MGFFCYLKQLYAPQPFFLTAKIANSAESVQEDLVELREVCSIECLVAENPIRAEALARNLAPAERFCDDFFRSEILRICTLRFALYLRL